jgi:hypothetical protein
MSTFAVGDRAGAAGYSAQGNPNTTPYVGRVGPGSKFQTAPNPYQTACDVTLAQTPHPAAKLVALADGSVRPLAPGIAPATWWGLLTPDGGEVLGPDW